MPPAETAPGLIWLDLTEDDNDDDEREARRVVRRRRRPVMHRR